MSKFVFSSILINTVCFLTWEFPIILRYDSVILNSIGQGKMYTFSALILHKYLACILQCIYFAFTVPQLEKVSALFSGYYSVFSTFLMHAISQINTKI